MGLITFGLGGGNSFSPTPTPAPTTVRDRTILAALRDLLVATKEFDEVLTSGLPEETGAAAGDLKLATLELAGFKEQGLGNDTTTNPRIRTVAYHLWLLVRNEDPDLRDDELDRLANVAANALSGVDLGATLFYDLSELKAGKYLAATGPERRLQMQGQFAYEIDGYAARDTSP